MRADYFAKKKRNSLLFLSLVGAVTILAIIITEYNIAKGFTSLPKAVEWGLGNFYPTQESLTKLPDILDKLIETLLVSIAATTT